MSPTQIVWSEEFTVGDEELDREHRRLVDLINLIYLTEGLGLERNEVGPLLDELLKSTQQHFNHENSILSHINRGQLPAGIDKAPFIKAMIAATIDEHVANHVSSFQQLSFIVRKIRSDLASDGPTLGAELKDWFVSHVTAHDAHLRPIFEALKQSSKLVTDFMPRGRAK